MSSSKNFIPLVVLFSLWGTGPSVKGQCPIRNATIRVQPGTEMFADRNNLQLIIEGITTGAIFTSRTWMRNGSAVDRNTPLPGGEFFDGGGESVHTGNPPCQEQMYRLALLVRGYAPGNYSYTATNAQTTGDITSPALVIQDPGPPTNIVLSQISNRRVQATWTPPAGFSGVVYRVYVNTMNVNTGGTPVTDGTTYTSDTLSIGFTVTLRIRATTGTYLSVPAVSGTITVRDVLAPTITSSVTTTSATLSLSQPTNSLPVDMYTAILTGITCTGVPTRTGSSPSNSVTIGSLEAGIQYSVSVTGRNNLAELTSRARSTTLTTSETAPSGSPGAPTSSATTSTSITITWAEIACLDRNGVITGYTIRYGPVNTSPTTIDHNNVNMRSRQITGLIPFTNYTISVRGVNSAGAGNYSENRVLQTNEGTPSAVIGLSGTPMFFSVVLTWSEPVPLNGILNTYTIRYSVNGSSEVTNTTSATTITITDLNPNTVVSNIRVRAATGGGEGPEATIADITTLTGPGEVEIVAVQVLSTTAVKVSWDNTSFQDITEFVVYYRETGCRMGQAQEMSTMVPASANSVTINNLLYGAQYVFEVVARVTAGDRSIMGLRTRQGAPQVLTTSMLTAVTSELTITSSQCSLQASARHYIAIAAVVAVVVTVIIYSIILVIIILVCRCSSKKITKQAEVKLEACTAYGQVSATESSLQYESVKGPENIYDN